MPTLRVSVERAGLQHEARHWRFHRPHLFASRPQQQLVRSAPAMRIRIELCIWTGRGHSPHAPYSHRLRPPSFSSSLLLHHPAQSLMCMASLQPPRSSIDGSSAGCIKPRGSRAGRPPAPALLADFQHCTASSEGQPAVAQPTCRGPPSGRVWPCRPLVISRFTIILCHPVLNLSRGALPELARLQVCILFRQLKKATNAPNRSASKTLLRKQQQQ